MFLIIQLSVDMDLGNTSRSSSSTSVEAEKLGRYGIGSLEASGANEDNKNMVTTFQEKQDPLITQVSLHIHISEPVVMLVTLKEKIKIKN